MNKITNTLDTSELETEIDQLVYQLYGLSIYRNRNCGRKMQQHTKEKLLIYKEYLKNYLSVMCNTSRSNIFIWEPFAGMGIDENNERGSALIAACVIKDFRDQHRKNIKLFLNELDGKKHKKLTDSVIDFQQFVDVRKMKAEKFLNDVTAVLGNSSTGKIHSLFFIDPYGYTQYSQENLRSLLKLKDADYLIFIPTNSIYRFKRAKGNPARQFVLDLGIEESALENINNIDSFVIKLTEILKKMADTEFGYNYELKK